MNEGAPELAWDFSPVYDLLRHFSINGEETTGTDTYLNGYATSTGLQIHHSDETDPSSSKFGLGNFDKVWQYLGQPLDLPQTSILTTGLDAPIQSIESGDSEEQKDTKAVRWRDEIDGADLADDDNADFDQDLKGLNKKQRKKANRGRRALALAEATKHTIKQAPSGSDIEGSESDAKVIQPKDRRDVIYSFIQGSSPPQLRSQSAISVLKRPQASSDLSAWPVARPQISNGYLRASSAPPEANYAAAAAKKQNLMTLLRERFPEDKQYLDSPSILPHVADGAGSTPEGIHVFVDASNIMIGFHDALKIKNTLPLSTRLPRQPLSFHNFSLVLTRGRPIAKQILVGSDNFPAIQEAKTIGYETNILDRVHKVKELTPRQRKYLADGATNGRKANGGGGHSTASAGSGSETGPATATTAMPSTPAPKWTEQAVDEILHLKMLESLVDQPALSPDSPASTMVLATGDAAEAEYSAGFLKMVERALLKGWRVELASFRANTSSMYKRREFRERWKGQFKMVELDNFVEELWGVA